MTARAGAAALREARGCRVGRLQESRETAWTYESRLLSGCESATQCRGAWCCSGAAHSWIETCGCDGGAWQPHGRRSHLTWPLLLLVTGGLWCTTLAVVWQLVTRSLPDASSSEHGLVVPRQCCRWLRRSSLLSLPPANRFRAQRRCVPASLVTVVVLRAQQRRMLQDGALLAAVRLCV